MAPLVSRLRFFISGNGFFALLMVMALVMGSFSFVSFAVERKTAPEHVFYSQVITFARGSSELSKADREALKTVFKTIKKNSQKVEQVHIAAWSDHATTATSSFTDKDRELAGDRIAALEDELEGPLGLSYVESYNMAERTNWFARALLVRPSEIQALFSQKGAPSNVTSEDFQTVKEKGAPSRAVLLIELEPQSASVH